MTVRGRHDLPMRQPFQKSPIGFNMYCATFPRHFRRQIVRYLLAHPNGADTVELARWAYDEPLPSISVRHEDR